jgi:hypothetical protein
MGGNAKRKVHNAKDKDKDGNFSLHVFFYCLHLSLDTRHSPLLI